jgi:hypothetical protein
MSIEIYDLCMGIKVRTNKEFSGVPKGTIGIVKEVNGSVAIECQDLPQYKEGYYLKTGKKLIDWFSEAELCFLEKI